MDQLHRRPVWRLITTCADHSAGPGEPVRTLRPPVCILGAGPAGVGAAWEFACADRGSEVLVVDRNSAAGGLARTEAFEGSHFDVGPHRFFTQNREVDALWHQALGNDFRPVSRLTRIYYRDKFFLYPVSAFDALPKLGPVAAGQALASYAWAALTQNADQAQTFEQWVAAKFGTRLYESFFKTYTEKVWGIPCSEIGADWAAQRIKGLDLLEVAKNAFGMALGSNPKTLVEEFDYPAQGAGQMYERMAESAAEGGVDFRFGQDVISVERDGDRLVAVNTRGPEGLVRIEAEQFLSTLPLTRFLAMVTPALPDSVLEACQALYYRDHITVNLVAQGADLFPDQWIYVHSPDVKMARLANYRNFSPDMAASADVSPISVEYFVFRDDPLWSMADGDLLGLATDELARMGLIPAAAVGPGWVVRETDSYPTYYLGFAEPYDVARQAMAGLENLQPAGRGGLYKYNNMDHSLYSGLLAARNLLAGQRRYDVWQINIDAEYHEAAARPS